MLFKQQHLDGIKSGAISLAFRKWNKAAVKKGSQLKTAIGVVAVTDIVEIAEADVTDQDALKAGFADRSALLKTLQQNSDGNLYRIRVSYHAEDPRIALRETVSFSDEEFGELQRKLKRLGSWPKDILLAIRAHPRLKAVDLAAITGKEKEWLKLNIRKLKNVGLTISHDPGYTLSPRGEVYLERLLISNEL